MNLKEALGKIMHSKAGYRVAVAAPNEDSIMEMLEEAVNAGLIKVWLVGDKASITHSLEGRNLPEGSFTIVHAEHHEVAESACKLVADGVCDILMKGNIHTDELLRAVIRGKLIDKGRRISHVYAILRPDASPIFISDPSISIYPALNEKEQIIENAVELLHRIGYKKPRVAILSSVENISDKIKSSQDAAELTRLFSHREDCVVSGPLGLDNAVSPLAAAKKKITGELAGNADVLIVPDLDSGNMLSKGLIYIAGMSAAGVLCGTKCPVVFTSRSAGKEERMNTLCFACLIAQV